MSGFGSFPSRSLFSAAKLQAGNWYIPIGNLNTGSVQGSTAARGVLIYVPHRVTISHLGVRVTTGAAGNVQLALYSANQDTLHPTTLVDKTASISTASAVVVTAALGASQTIEAGFYWLFGQLDATASGNSVVLQALSGGSPLLASIQGDPTETNVSTAGAAGMVGVNITNTFGTWGDFTGATATPVGGTTQPAVLFKVSSVP